MAAKRKLHHGLAAVQRSDRSSSASDPKRQLAEARRAHAKGYMSMEDFIWTAMQCYNADKRMGA